MKKEDLIDLCPSGWVELLKQWFIELEEDWFNINNISYLKEKYWQLRFEWKYHKVLDYLETASSYICQECWSVWRTRYDLGWYKTLCNDCYIKLKNKNGWED